jgi:hypothetical protein
MLTAFSTYKVHTKDLFIIDRISLVVFIYDPPASGGPSGSIPVW